MRVLLVPDVPGWAWDHKASAIRKYLKTDFDVIDKVFTSDFGRNARSYIGKYDSIHFFGWMDGVKYANKATAGISSYNYEIKHWNHAVNNLKRYQAITAVSQALFNRLTEQGLHEKIYCTPNGVDHNVFHPIKRPANKKFVIGWVGQPTHGQIGMQGAKGQVDQHGYTSVFKPLQEILSVCDDVEFKVLDRIWTNALPHKELINFYNECDCQIHTGYLTGTPNPIFEAAACGKAVISTRIGAAIDMIEDGINGYKVDAYASEEDVPRVLRDFVEKITYLKDNRDLCEVMGERSRKIIEESWTWKERAKQWIPVFRNHKTTQ